MEVEPKEIGFEFAGFWVRLWASIVDAIALGFIGIILYNFVPPPTIWLLLGLVVTIYFVGFWWWRGQTLGKMLLGIKVICSDNSPLTLARAFLRYVGFIVCCFTLFLGFIWLAFDSKRQGLHDKIANTYVIKLSIRDVVLVKTYA